jgi:hypothetical protein
MAMHARQLLCSEDEVSKLPPTVFDVTRIEKDWYKIRAKAYSSCDEGTLIPMISLEEAMNTPYVECNCQFCNYVS